MTNATERPQLIRRAPIVVAIAVLTVLVIAFFSFASVYADVLWYQQVGFIGIFMTEWAAGIAFFLGGFVAMAVPVWVSISVAYRLRPVYVRLNSQLDRYQQIVEPLRRLLTWAVPVALGLVAGLTTVSNWQTALLWFNSTPSGTTDPQFGFDVSFYMFELPFYQTVVAFFSAVVLLSLLVTVLSLIHI